MQILVSLGRVIGNLPIGVQFAGSLVSVTDDAGATQSETLTGNETPTPWAAEFTVSDGHGGTVSAQDVDSTGAAIGEPQSVNYDSTGTGGGTTGDEFSALGSIGVTPVTA